MEQIRIIGKLVNRDESAIKDIDECYGRLCIKISDGILKNPQDTQECVNTAYFKVWNSIPPAQPKSLCGYLCTIVRNTAIEMYRKSKKNNAANTMEELSEIFSTGKTPQHDAEIAEAIKTVNGFLLSSDKKTRLAFTMRYYFNMSIKDISENLYLTENSVKLRLLRTRRALKDKLIENGFNGAE